MGDDRAYGGQGRFVRVVHDSVGHPKFIGLTAAERGTWVTALVLADIAYPNPIHEASVLEKCPDASFERLYKRELIEKNGREGWFYVHDLKQFHVYPSSTPEAVAERKRRSRANAKVSQLSQVSQAVTDVTEVTGDETIQDKTRDSTSSSVGLVGPRDPDRPTRRSTPRRIGQ